MMWNLRYVCYAQSHGNTPEEQLASDREEFAGGCMAGFLIWTSQHWEAFERLHPRTHGEDLALWRATHADAFDIWLQKDLS